ncbi:MAG: Ig-like domain-containing protein [Clostridia bacterium]|nr:Ig-like domain-containing protein [Clostridia bacterium]
MKRIIGILPAIVLLAALLCLPVQAAQSGETSFRALLVGIDSYQNNPLEGCTTDAARMAATLQTANEAGAFYQTPVIRTNLQSSEILALFDEIGTWSVDEDDITTLYFAGCGFLSDKGNAAIVGKDSKMIALSELKESLDQIPGVKLLILDCRYTDSLIAQGTDAGAALADYNSAVESVFADASSGSNPIYVLSAVTLASSETAYLNAGEAPRGLVTWALTRGCGYDYDQETPLDSLAADANSNDSVSLSEAADYILDAVNDLKSAGKKVTCNVRAIPSGSAYPLLSRRATAEVLEVTLASDEIDLPAGKTTQVEATTQPVNASLRTINWTSDDQSIATIDENGVITGVRPGTVRIAATTANGLTRFATVTVRDVKFVESLEFGTARLTLGAGAEIDLPLKVTPDYANEAIRWQTADPSIATVDQSGHVVMRSTGNTYISAYSENGVEATCSVQVVEADRVVTDFKLSKTEVELYEGQTYQFEAECKPENAEDVFITYVSSDESVVTVDSSDVAHGMGKGEATIVATASSGISKTIKVKVKEATISLEKSALNLRSGKKGTLKTRIQPKGQDVLVTWTSSDESVATVENGVVTAVASGACTITAAIPTGASATCNVTVDAVIVKKIAVKPTEARMDIGAQRKLDIKTEPKQVPETSLNWTSSNLEVVTVDGEGNVTAVASGTATVKVTANSGKSASCKIKVNPIAVTEVKLSQSEASLVADMEGENKITLVAETLPEGAGNGSLKWRSDHPEVARVDSMGNVTAISPGKAVIRASAAAGSKAFAVCQVTVARNGVSNKKPIVGNAQQLYTSARKIGYQSRSLVIDLWFSNHTKKAIKVPVAGQILLTLQDGTELQVKEIKGGSKKLPAGKSGHIEYRINLNSHADWSGLDLRGATAELVTASGSTAAGKEPEPAETAAPDTGAPAETPAADDAAPEDADAEGPLQDDGEFDLSAFEDAGESGDEAIYEEYEGLVEDAGDDSENLF